MTHKQLLEKIKLYKSDISETLYLAIYDKRLSSEIVTVKEKRQIEDQEALHMFFLLAEYLDSKDIGEITNPVTKTKLSFELKS